MKIIILKDKDAKNEQIRVTDILGQQPFGRSFYITDENQNDTINKYLPNSYNIHEFKLHKDMEKGAIEFKSKMNEEVKSEVSELRIWLINFHKIV